VIFETLNESNERGELMLVDGGMCHWHLRRDGQLTIREIIVEKYQQRTGIGTWMIQQLAENVLNANSLFAKCPADLPANSWYEHMGFTLEATETTRSGRQVNHWRLLLTRNS
jgi:hypothetical protein